MPFASISIARKLVVARIVKRPIFLLSMVVVT